MLIFRNHLNDCRCDHSLSRHRHIISIDAPLPCEMFHCEVFKRWYSCRLYMDLSLKRIRVRSGVSDA